MTASIQENRDQSLGGSSGDAFSPRFRASHRALLRSLGLTASIAIAVAGCMQSEFDESDPLECVFIPTGEIFRQSSPLFLSSGNWTVSVERGEWTQQITNETADKWRCRKASGTDAKIARVQS